MIDVYSDELRDYIYEVDNAKRREVLLLVEKEIKRLNTKGANDFYLLSADEETIDKIEDLVNTRCFILNNMFQATDQTGLPAYCQPRWDAMAPRFINKKGAIMRPLHFQLSIFHLNKRNRFRIFNSYHFLRPVRIGFYLEIILPLCRIIHHRKLNLLIRIQ